MGNLSVNVYLSTLQWFGLPLLSLASITLTLTCGLFKFRFPIYFEEPPELPSPVKQIGAKSPNKQKL
jgi:hypothetical protein